MNIIVRFIVEKWVCMPYVNHIIRANDSITSGVEQGNNLCLAIVSRFIQSPGELRNHFLVAYVFVTE